MEVDIEDSSLSDLSSSLSSSQSTTFTAAQSDDGGPELTDYCLSGEEVADKTLSEQRGIADEGSDPVSFIEISCDEEDVAEADHHNDDADESIESDEETTTDFPHILQQRQSSYDTDVFFHKAFHHLQLMPAGIQRLQSTEAGRAALHQYHTEGEKVQSRTREVPQRYKSPDVIQLLIDNPKGSLLPIIAKNDEILLKFDMTIMFPGRQDHCMPTAEDFHRSGLNAAISDFYTENRKAMGIRKVTVLPVEVNDEYFKILLSLEPCQASRVDKPLAVLESIVIKLRSTNKGHSKIRRDVQWQRREKTCQAILDRQLPHQLLKTLERALSRSVKVDLVQKYGALFNGAYTARAQEVESCFSRIARCMAEMTLRHEKLREVVGEDEEEEAFGRDAHPRGLHRAILETTEKDVEIVKSKTGSIQRELTELDRRGVPTDDFKPTLILLSETERKDDRSRRGAARSNSSTMPRPRPKQKEVRSSQPPRSSHAPSSISSRRQRSLTPSTDSDNDLPPIGADTISSSQRSSQRTTKTSAPPGMYAEEESESGDVDSDSSSESDSDGVVEVEMIDGFQTNIRDTLSNNVLREDNSVAQKANDVEDILTSLKKLVVFVSDIDSRSNFLNHVEKTVLDHELNYGYNNDGIDHEKAEAWDSISAIVHRRRRGQCPDEECFSVIGGALNRVKKVEREKAVEDHPFASGDVLLQKAEPTMMAVQGQESEAEANISSGKNPKPMILHLRHTRSALPEVSSDRSDDATSNEQSRAAKRRRLGEGSQSAEKEATQNGKEREVQVNGGCVEGAESSGRRANADNEIRLGTMVQASARVSSQGAEQRGSHVRACLPVIERRSSTPEEGIVSEGSISGSLRSPQPAGGDGRKGDVQQGRGEGGAQTQQPSEAERRKTDRDKDQPSLPGEPSQQHNRDGSAAKKGKAAQSQSPLPSSKPRSEQVRGKRGSSLEHPIVFDD